jgi:hypothetical protein
LANIAKPPPSKKPRLSRKRAPPAPQPEPESSDDEFEFEFEFEFCHNATWDNDNEFEEQETLPNVTDIDLQPAMLLKETYTCLDLKDKLHERQVHLPEGFFDQEPLHGAFTCFLEKNPEPCTGCTADDVHGEALEPENVTQDYRWDLPFLFFSLFFDDDIFDDISRAANRYAEHKGAGGERQRP